MVHTGALRATEATEEAPAPIVKWAGGKGRLLTQLKSRLPPGFGRRRYLEPFIGGGALFFSLTPSRAILSDVNTALIETYRAVRDQVDEVLVRLERLASGHCKENFYETRARYNREELESVDRAATFLYLNKTCFNGLHRVNRRGEFNVPFGRYKNPRILDVARLRAASRLLGGAELKNAPFEHVLETARPGDFVYFDPPYVPMSDTANFTNYAQNGFGPEDQARLRDVYRQLDRRGCHLMLSNSDVPEVRKLYQGFSIDIVSAPRAISCDARNRKAVHEVVVTNYTTPRSLRSVKTGSSRENLVRRHA